MTKNLNEKFMFMFLCTNSIRTNVCIWMLKWPVLCVIWNRYLNVCEFAFVSTWSSIVWCLGKKVKCSLEIYLNDGCEIRGAMRLSHYSWVYHNREVSYFWYSWAEPCPGSLWVCSILFIVFGMHSTDAIILTTTTKEHIITQLINPPWLCSHSHF